MAAYLVSYDLIKVKDYPKLEKAIQGLGTSRRVLASVWIISSTKSIDSIMKSLRAAIDHDDELLVVKIESRQFKCTDTITKEHGDWIGAYVFGLSPSRL